jgi:hypothetical protein
LNTEPQIKALHVQMARQKVRVLTTLTSLALAGVFLAIGCESGDVLIANAPTSISGARRN